MSSFNDLFNRVQMYTEAKTSPYATAHSSFGGVTKQMRAGGLSSAPLDTIKFIREILFNLDVITEEELQQVKNAKGFTGKKQAMLAVLNANQEAINAKTDEIAQAVESSLDDFISGMGVNRSREEKYAAQAASQEIASEIRKAKSGKELDDALTDIVSDEKLLVKASLAKAIQELEDLPAGEDLNPEVINNIKEFAPNINTIEQFEAFVKQMGEMEEYQIPAYHLSGTVKAIKGGLEDVSMEDQEDPDEVVDYDPSYTAHEVVDGEDAEASAERINRDEDGEGKYDDGDDEDEKCDYVPCEDAEHGCVCEDCPDCLKNKKELTLESIYDRMEYIVIENTIDENGSVTPTHQYLAEAAEQLVEEAENYTTEYLNEQKEQDSYKTAPKEQSVSFKERFQPKTHWQLEEIRRYGL